MLEQGTPEMRLLVPPCAGYVTSGKSLHPWQPDFSSGRLHQQPRKALAPPGPWHPEKNSMMCNPKCAHLQDRCRALRYSQVADGVTVTAK